MSPLFKHLCAAALTVMALLPLEAKVSLPQHNESALLQCIIISDRTTERDLWNFSEAETTGDPVEVRFATETHFVRVSDTIPLPIIAVSHKRD